MAIIKLEDCPNCGNENTYATHEGGNQECRVCRWMRKTYDVSGMDPVEVAGNLMLWAEKMRAEGHEIEVDVEYPDEHTKQAVKDWIATHS